MKIVKVLGISLSLLLMVVALTACFSCNHEWMEATCEQPKTCTKCSITEGTALGHSWEAATCAHPKTCSECLATEGDALGEHIYQNGKCIYCQQEEPHKEDDYETLEKVLWQCEHNLKLAFDQTAKIESKCDREKNIYTVYVINLGLTAKEMREFDWKGNGQVVLNLETSINQLCLSLKNAFDTSELVEDYTVYMHFTDTNKKIYFTSENGVPVFSLWD